MRVASWVRTGLVGCFLLQGACVGERVTPLATAADFGPAPASGGWTVASTFGAVSFEQFQAGDVVIIPLKAVKRDAAERFDTSRSAFSYETDIPNPNAGIRERYAWGTSPIDNGHGTFHWYHERLAFDLKSHRVFVLPRKGLAKVNLRNANGTQFWCRRDALQDTTVAIDSDTHSGEVDVCPTAFIRWTGENKGPPLLVGLQKDAFVIDSRFIATLIAELHLDEEVGRVRGAEDTNRQLAKIAQVQDDQQRSLEAERVRTVGPRGQAMIDRAEVGALLCADIQLGNMPAVISAFLEGVHGDKVQLRINNIRSPDGRSTITLKAPIAGIDYTSGNVVWVNRHDWRACE